MKKLKFPIFKFVVAVVIGFGAGWLILLLTKLLLPHLQFLTGFVIIAYFILLFTISFLVFRKKVANDLLGVLLAGTLLTVAFFTNRLFFDSIEQFDNTEISDDLSNDDRKSFEEFNDQLEGHLDSLNIE